MKISIVVKKDMNVSKYIVIIRKITGKSLADIKNSIENETPVIEYILFKNDDGKEKVEKFINELINFGASLKIIKEENKKIEEISVNHLLNRINRFREISKQNQEIDDLMYEED